MKEKGFTDGNLSGIAFVKLDQAFETLQKENEKKENKNGTIKSKVLDLTSLIKFVIKEK